jgi:hypothetical protein
MKFAVFGLMTAICIFGGYMAFKESQDKVREVTSASETLTLPPRFSFVRDLAPGEVGDSVPLWETQKVTVSNLVKIQTVYKVGLTKTCTENIIWNPETGAGQWSARTTGPFGGVSLDRHGEIKIIIMTAGNQIGSCKVVFYEKGLQLTTGVLVPDWTSI